MKPDRLLDDVETRILGCLLEKQLITPDVYPLTLNSLRSAANQTTNRDPVMSLEDADLEPALGRLQQMGFVWKVMGGRAVRWDHKLAETWDLTSATSAIIALLLLRGAQTSGELRARSDRMHRFDSIANVEEALESLTAGDDPLVEELPRRPGQKENRWIQLVGARPLEDDSSATVEAPEHRSLAARVDELETEVDELRAEIRRLKELLGEGD